MHNPKLGYIGIMGCIGNILGVYGDNGKENGNYHNGLYRVYTKGFKVQGLGFGV